MIKTENKHKQHQEELMIPLPVRWIAFVIRSSNSRKNQAVNLEDMSSSSIEIIKRSDMEDSNPLSESKTVVRYDGRPRPRAFVTADCPQRVGD